MSQSWWIDPNMQADREAFYARVRVESARMNAPTMSDIVAALHKAHAAQRREAWAAAHK